MVISGYGEDERRQEINSGRLANQVVNQTNSETNSSVAINPKVLQSTHLNPVNAD
jgi:hypothetical protein